LRNILLIRFLTKFLFPITYIFSNFSNCFAKPSDKYIDGITTGIGEKGIYFGINKRLGKRNQIDLGIQKIKVDIGSYDQDLFKAVPIKYESENIKFIYTRYLHNDSSSTGFYGQLGIDYSTISASSTIDLSKQKYYIGKFEVTCRTCKDLIVEAKNESSVLIPSVSLGWQLALNKKFYIRFGGGIQYFNLPNVSWRTNMESTPPKFVRDKIDNIEKDINDNINQFSAFLPTVFISTSYYF
tara:strand:- start:921 stop:1640 length:720 start_codon:yes stop_codon:yes gene_type:complete